MKRRQFLLASGQAALSASLLPLVACSRETEPTAKPRAAPPWESLIAYLHAQIPELMDRRIVPGLSIAIIKEGAVAWRQAYGYKDNTSRERVDDDTIFEAASMSKPVFAYAVMKLCEKGVMNLDTPLTKYTSQRFLQGDPLLDLITARHVLSHTSGFQNWRSEQEPLRIHFAPGAQYRYSGEGYSYLQAVVTQLTGKIDPNDCSTYEAGLEVCATDIERHMRASLLAPFGMTSSGYLWTDPLERRAARPHDREGRPLTKGRPKPSDVARYGAAGGLHATPTDYAKFVIEVIDPKSSDAFRLTKASVDEMIRPHVKVPADPHPSSWALGWQVQPTGAINHGGGNDGFHCHAVASPKTKSGFVIMTNGDGGAELIRDLLLGDLMQKFL